MLLRHLHGDVYTNERKYRFGLTQDPNCTHCGQLDTLDHRLTRCPRSIEVLTVLERKIGEVAVNDREAQDPVACALGVYNRLKKSSLALTAETIEYISSTRTEPAIRFLERITIKLLKLEKNEQTRNELREILNRYND